MHFTKMFTEFNRIQVRLQFFAAVITDCQSFLILVKLKILSVIV